MNKILLEIFLWSKRATGTFRCRLLRLIRKPEEIYINQPVKDRYRDFQEIGTWGIVTKDEMGELHSSVKGKMLAETVKYLGEDGTVKLGRDWIPDNDRHVMGFDSTNYDPHE